MRPESEKIGRFQNRYGLSQKKSADFETEMARGKKNRPVSERKRRVTKKSVDFKTEMVRDKNILLVSGVKRPATKNSGGF
jgi:hypothetical protein